MLNLPENVRTFLQLHGGDPYTSQLDAAIRWYERTELISQDFSKVPSLSLSTMTERVEEHPEDDAALGAAFPSKPSKPKSLPAKKDMSTVECWKCGKKGHYSRDCKSSAPSTPRGGKGSKSSSSSNQKPKGKGKVNGKKGLRAAELSEEGDGEAGADQQHEEGDYEQQSEWSEIDQNEQDELRLTGLLYPYYPWMFFFTYMNG